MRLALLASGPVGADIAEVLQRRGVTTVLLVLDAGDMGGANSRLRSSVDPGTPVLEWDGHTAQSDVAALLRELSVDVGLLAWWPRIVRQEVIDAPTNGLLNLHPSLLPHCRGKDPNFWAIVEGAPFGVTLHFVDAGIDTGPIAFQAEIPVSWEDTGGSLYAKAQAAAVTLVEHSLDAILAGEVPRRAQEPTAGSFHLRNELDGASRLDLDAPTTARAVLDLLRARTFPPHPAVRFTDGGTEYEARVEIRRVGPT